MSDVPRVIIPAPLWCPHCGERHIDEERNGTKWHRRAHTTHRCQHCRQDFDVYVSGAPSPAETPQQMQRRIRYMTADGVPVERERDGS